MIGEIKDNAPIAQAQAQSGAAQTRSVKPGAAAQQEAAQAADSVELGSASQSSAGTYTKTSRKLSGSEIASIKSAAEQAYANLRVLVEQLLKSQHKSVGGSANTNKIDSVSAMDPAQQAISEDGEFGVKAVSDRIVQFAVAVSGGDRAQYEKLKAAIDKGFQQASKALGGELPAISQQTYREVMRKLENWKNSTDAA
jgi:hypothetical protein